MTETDLLVPMKFVENNFFIMSLNSADYANIVG